MKIYTLFIFLLFSFGCNLQQKTTPFNEAFEGSLTENWTIETHTFENNLAQFITKNAEIENGKLVLILTNEKTARKSFSGAEIRTKKKFLYGIFKARLKASDAEGCISAFFLYTTNSRKNNEIDIEISGKYPKVLTTNHWVNANANVKDLELPFNTSKGFHDYVIDWQPKKIMWLVDGLVVHTATKAIPHKPMQVMFNLWATKSVKWAGEIKNAKLPAKFEIETFNFVPYKKQP